MELGWREVSEATVAPAVRVPGSSCLSGRGVPALLRKEVSERNESWQVARNSRRGTLVGLYSAPPADTP